jgi:hypothetical protein
MENLIKSIKCKLGFHQYTKGHYIISDYLNSTDVNHRCHISSYGYYDFRKCIDCGKMQCNHGKRGKPRTKWYDIDKDALLAFEKYQRISDWYWYDVYVIGWNKPQFLTPDQIERLNKMINYQPNKL